MRNYATIERRKLREEFVYKYACEIGELIVGYDKEKIKQFIEGTCLKELDYNCKTNWIDIFFFLRRTFFKLFNQ